MNRLRYIASVVLLVLLNACTPEEWTEVKMDDGMKPTSLTLSLSSFDVSVGTRGLENPDSDPTTWTPMERVADGREIYRLTAFLINKENTLVAYRDIYYSDPKTSDVDAENGFWDGAQVGQNVTVGQQVKFTFNYDTNKHGKIEKLVQGEYTLIAMANYSPYLKYQGLKTGTADFTSIVQNIINKFNENTGITNFDRANNSDFFNFHLDAGTDFICPKNQPQPLTLVKKIHLLPGNNQVTGELKRTYARIRINLANQSQEYDLKINKFSFNNLFTQQKAYLFEDLTNPEFIYSFPITEKGAPQTESDDAIISYDNSQSYKITKGKNQIIFDAYILESKGDVEDYMYKIDVEYLNTPKPAKYSSYTYKKLEVIKTKENLDLKYDKFKKSKEIVYLIHNNDKKYLKDDDKKEDLSVGTINNLDNLLIDPKAINPYSWILEKTGGQYKIKTKIGEKYMGGPEEGFYHIDKILWWQEYNPNDNVKLSASTTNFVQVPISMSNSTGGLGLYQEGNEHSFYITINGNITSITKSQKTTYVIQPIIFNSIQLQTIDPVTSKVTPVTNIKRNDFINIYITSNYKEKNSSLEFEVRPWENKNNDITFN